jgi:hypothetical protein
VALEKTSPPPIAELGCPLGRADNVGKEHGEKAAIRRADGPGAGQKRLDLVNQRVDIPGEGEMVDAL